MVVNLFSVYDRGTLHVRGCGSGVRNLEKISTQIQSRLLFWRKFVVDMEEQSFVFMFSFLQVQVALIGMRT